MDPVSAAGFASSIITFIDFSYKIVQGSISLYDSASGASAENAAISTVVDDLRKITDVIAQPPTSETDSPHWKELRKLAGDCNAVSQELADILENLKRKDGNKAWRSLEAAWKSMRKSKEIAAIEERLKTYRVQLLLRTNLILNDNQASVQRQLDELKKGDVAHFNKTIDELDEIRRVIIVLGTKVLAKAGQSLQISPYEDQETALLDDLRAELAAVVQSLEAIPRRTPADLLVLNRLYFGTLYSRVDSIHDAEFGTFSWFLRDESIEDDYDHDSDSLYSRSFLHSTSEGGSNIQDQASSSSGHIDSVETHLMSIRATARQSFQAWLESGSGVFHISGKAGSGKSTFMKLLGHDSEPRNRLEVWADDKILVFASFYFWISGDDQQSSLEGLYRSLLFETLSKCPGLVQEAFPEFWRAAQASHAERAAWHQSPFRLPELREAMRRLIQYPEHQRHRFCFFIDGLDEFQGDSNDHWELAQLLRQWTESPDVKLCVSSRPHQEFLEAFDSQQRLHLHELTKHDIRRFVSKSLSKERVDHVDRVFLDKAITSITNDAQGVFLWARLVVRSLLEGIRCHESPRRLQQRISQAPGDVQSLVRQLFDGIPPANRHLSDQMLYIAALHPNVSTLVLSWLEDLADPAFPFESQLPKLSEEQCSPRLKAAEAQIKSLSGGLLEIENSNIPGWPQYHQVAVFFHRTARDFLMQPDVRSAMEHRLGGNFDENEAYQRLYLAEFKSTEYRYRDSALQELRHVVFVRCKPLPQFLVALAAELESQTKAGFIVQTCVVRGHSPVISRYIQEALHSAGSNFSLLHMLVNVRPDRCDGVDELRKAPDIYQQQGGLCLLFSACMGSAARVSSNTSSLLIKDMIIEGELMDLMVGMLRTFSDSQLSRSWELVPGWVAFIYCIGYIWKSSYHGVSWDVLEMLLDALPSLDIRWELARTRSEDRLLRFQSSTECFSYTLEDLIVRAKPPNIDVLLTEMVRRRSRIGWFWSNMMASWMMPGTGSKHGNDDSVSVFPDDTIDQIHEHRILRIWAGGVSWEFPPDPWFRIW